MQPQAHVVKAGINEQLMDTLGYLLFLFGDDSKDPSRAMIKLSEEGFYFPACKTITKRGIALSRNARVHKLVLTRMGTVLVVMTLRHIFQSGRGLDKR